MSDEDEMRMLGIVEIFPNETVDVVVFWNWYETIKERGIDQALQMAILSVQAITGSISEDQQARLLQLLAMIEWRAEQSTDKSDYALRTSYYMLRRHDWNRTRAAHFASLLLRKDVEPETWRKAVNKWAEVHGLPKPDLPRGRPNKGKGVQRGDQK